MFNYKLSLIIPIYNSADYLDRCINSILNQTIKQDEIEILLINDGSTDNSLQICNKYKKQYSNIIVIDKPNTGVSDTRNTGISHAKGKYIAFLDSDDTLSKETLLEVVLFFDNHYEEVDLVTYKIETFKNGIKLKDHDRYDILTESRIYDLIENPYISQTTMNILVKNKFSNNVMFDKNMFYTEDQKYCCDILKDKMKIGYCSKGKYKYTRYNESTSGKYTSAYYIFEQGMYFFENLFNKFDKEMPSYFQALYVKELSWKLISNSLYPYHYSKNKFSNAMNRIIILLNKVDNKIILNHPSIDFFHKYYFISLKTENTLTLYTENNKFMLIDNESVVHLDDKIEIVITKLKIKDGKVKINAFLKSVIFNFMQKPELLVITNNSIEKLKLNLSSHSYYNTHTITNRFWAFEFEKNVNSINSFYFKIGINGCLFNAFYYFMPLVPLNKELQRYQYSNEDIQLVLKNNNFLIKKITQKEYLSIINLNTKIVSHLNSSYANLRKSVKYTHQSIWLYYDCCGVDYDNGFIQFMHDINIRDSVLRFYVTDKCKSCFDKKIRKYIIKFGCEKHKILFLNSKKIITSFIEEYNWIPFTLDEYKYFCDMFCFDVVYLQHGILHASVPWKYSPEKIYADKIVVSSKFEINNFTNKYKFNKADLLPYGMPRLSFIDTTNKLENRILFAPSWRSYLIGDIDNRKWNLTKNKFIESDYFQNIITFLNNSKLEEILIKNNLFLDFQLHPIFKEYSVFFKITNSRVHVLKQKENFNSYKLFITDFSSLLFDFVYKKKPILYFIPDYNQFRSGMNSYRQLDLEFYNGFGSLSTSVNEIIKEISNIIENNFLVNEVYLDRISNFYLNITNSCDNIYKAIK